MSEQRAVSPAGELRLAEREATPLDLPWPGMVAWRASMRRSVASP